MKSIAFVGMDVHAETVSICVLSGASDEKLDERTLPSTEAGICRYLVRLSEKWDLRCCYEASSCGYVFYRWLRDRDISCEVIAPSLVPVRSGDRVKTDRRDARKLARLYKAGELTAVRVPSAQEEADRGLLRCRETLVKEVVQSKNYLLKFLRLRSVTFLDGKSRWTQKHWAWLRSLRFEGADKIVFEEYLTLLEFKLLRLADLDRQVEELAQTPPYQEAVRALSCFRGINTLSAMTLLTETQDFRRFGSPRSLMDYYGVVPSEHTSSNIRRQGSITKAGNSRCRRVLVEAGWHYRNKPGLSEALKKRQLGQPASIVAHAWKAQHRLHKKFWRIASRKEKQKAVVAVARELVGFLWAVMNPHRGAYEENTAPVEALPVCA